MSIPHPYEHEGREKILARNTLAPTTVEIVALFGVWLFYLVTDQLFGSTGHLTANLGGPLAMTGILVLGAWRMIRVDARYVCTALFWFRISTAVYFGVGTYAVFIANDFTRLYLESFHQFFDEDVLKMNLVVSLSVALVLVAAKIVIIAAGGESRHGPSASISGESGPRSLPAVGTLFLVAGLAVTYGLKVPQDFGWITEQLPGVLVGLSRLTTVGIFMLTLWSLERARWFLPIITAIAGVEMLFSLLLFAKSGILMTLMMYLLAFLWNKVTIRRALLCAAVVVGTYVSLDGLVGYGRSEVETSGNVQAGFGRRLEIVGSYFMPNAAEGFQDVERQGALLRISYVNAATFVISLYDSGIPAEWPSLLPAVFVPRFLWPEKPIISDVGIDIYELGTGRRTSSVGAGVFADAYFAMGWTGVLVYMPIYGLILGLLTLVASNVLHEAKWLLFPVVLLAMSMGLRTDGHYLVDVAGASVIIAGMYVVLLVLDRTLAGLIRGSPEGSRQASWR
jgi:hypothetical protein